MNFTESDPFLKAGPPNKITFLESTIAQICHDLSAAHRTVFLATNERVPICIVLWHLDEPPISRAGAYRPRSFCLWRQFYRAPKSAQPRASITRLIAGCIRFFTFSQSFDRPA